MAREREITTSAKIYVRLGQSVSAGAQVCDFGWRGEITANSEQYHWLEKDRTCV